jgi:katanin p60 ATPase-containing subunit A1
MGRFEACDNVDLLLVLAEYEAYYEFRYDRKPKITKKLKDGEESSASSSASRRGQQRPTEAKKSNSGTAPSSSSSSKGASSGKLPTVNGATAADDDTAPSFGIQGTGMTGEAKGGKRDDSVDRIEERLLKPPPQFGGDVEMKQLAASVSREIYQESPDVR